MVIMRKWTRPILILMHIFSIANQNTQLWISAGYDQTLDEMEVSREFLSTSELSELQVSLISPASINKSNPFIAIEIERAFSTSYSGSLKAVLSNFDKSIIKPLFTHNSGIIIESYGKYHYNNFSYLIGYSLQHDDINISLPSELFSSSSTLSSSQITTSIVLGSEIALTNASRLTFTTMSTLPVYDAINKAIIASKSHFSVKISLAYNIDKFK